MGASLRSWWQQIKQHSFIATGIIVVLFVLIVFVFAAYRFGWSGTGFLNKTLWDWLQLLIIPLALAIIAIFFNRAERKNEQRIASDNQQETALQVYIKEMSELFLHEDLPGSNPKKEVREIARIQTLTVLNRLDGKRSGSVLQFLYESGLIDRARGQNSIKLRGADLRKAELGGTDLAYANLSGVELTGANLERANLKGANLVGTNLVGANLEGANLRYTNLTCATLTGANFSGTNFSGGNLYFADFSGELYRDSLPGAKITELERKLKKAKSLQGATMPDGSIHP